MGYTYDRRRMPTMDSRTEQTASAPQRETMASPMSNSAMLAYMGLDKGVGDPDLGTKIRGRLAPLRRIAEIPAAEREADTLSEGIKARTPEQVKQEMGERLGSDFSSVRFHSDSSSVAQADSMGARAWAQGNDVFFGEGGFSPDVAAHELVHTVQQGAVSGNVSQPAPNCVVQMVKSQHKRKNRQKRHRNRNRNRWRNFRRGNPNLRGYNNRKFKGDGTKHHRPWQIEYRKLKANPSNPDNIEILKQVQNRIRDAKSDSEAYRIFSKFSGNKGGKLIKRNRKKWNPGKNEMPYFRKRLINMIRTVYDYPILLGKIGNMKKIGKNSDDSNTIMYAEPPYNNTGMSKLGYNPQKDLPGRKGRRIMRQRITRDYRKRYSSAPPSYNGNHEMGHVMHFQLTNDVNDIRYGITTDNLIKKVFKKAKKTNILTYHDSDGTDSEDNEYLEGQINLAGSHLKNHRFTSGYGESNPDDFFAEAVADVYHNGKAAMKTSKMLMQAYENEYEKKHPGEMINKEKELKHLWKRLLRKNSK